MAISSTCAASPAGDDYFMDGLRDTGLYDRDTFDYESLEVYKGPASTLFGRGSTGGVINQVMKSPQLYPIDDFSRHRRHQRRNARHRRRELRARRHHARCASTSWARTTASWTVPSCATSAGASRRPSPSASTRTRRFTLKYLHQQEDNIPDYGIPFLFDKPAPVARDTFYGLPADDRFKTDVDVVTGRFEHTFNDTFSVSDTARYGSYWFDSRQTAAIYGSAQLFRRAVAVAI